MKTNKPRPLTPQEKELLHHIGRRITALRQRTGWTQANSKVVGFRQFGIGELEKGESNPRLTTLRDICNEMGTTVSDLLRGLA